MHFGLFAEETSLVQPATGNAQDESRVRLGNPSERSTSLPESPHTTAHNSPNAVATILFVISEFNLVMFCIVFDLEDFQSCSMDLCRGPCTGVMVREVLWRLGEFNCLPQKRARRNLVLPQPQQTRVESSRLLLIGIGVG
jgi:hypothetical protein